MRVLLYGCQNNAISLIGTSYHHITTGYQPKNPKTCPLCFTLFI